MFQLVVINVFCNNLDVGIFKVKSGLLLLMTTRI
jgi:hypothetical protein